MRVLSTEGLKGILSETTDQVYLFALKIVHPELENTVYVVQNNVDLTVDLPDEGKVVFTAYGFDFALPTVEEASLPQAQIKIDNINDFLIPWLRTISEAPEFNIYVIRKSPDNSFAETEIGPLTFVLRSVNWDAYIIDGTLTMDYDYLNEPCMKYTFTPDIAIGLFDYSYEGAGSFISETTDDGDFIRRPLPVRSEYIS